VGTCIRDHLWVRRRHRQVLVVASELRVRLLPRHDDGVVVALVLGVAFPCCGLVDDFGCGAYGVLDAFEDGGAFRGVARGALPGDRPAAALEADVVRVGAQDEDLFGVRA